MSERINTELLDALKACVWTLAKLVAASGAFTEEHACVLDGAHAAIIRAEQQAEVIR